MRAARDVIAEFQKTAGGRLTLYSVTVLTEGKSYGTGTPYIDRTSYDVDYSRAYGYLIQMSGFGWADGPVEVSGIYWVSGNPKVTERPTTLVDAGDEPPWKSRETMAIRERNRTRRLKRLPKFFNLSPGWDLFDWLESRAIHDEAVWCSTCGDHFPAAQLCRHCWWCENIGAHSTPSDRCSCQSREECNREVEG